MKIQVSSLLLCLFLTGTTVHPFQPVGQSLRVSKTSTSTSLPALQCDDDNTSSGRRAFVAGGVMAAASTLLFPQYAMADGNSVDYKAVAKDIIDVIQKNPDWGPSKFSNLFHQGDFCALAMFIRFLHC
jgi:hypothetical protein